MTGACNYAHGDSYAEKCVDEPRERDVDVRRRRGDEMLLPIPEHPKTVQNHRDSGHRHPRIHQFEQRLHAASTHSTHSNRFLRVRFRANQFQAPLRGLSNTILNSQNTASSSFYLDFVSDFYAFQIGRAHV